MPAWAEQLGEEVGEPGSTTCRVPTLTDSEASANGRSRARQLANWARASASSAAPIFVDQPGLLGHRQELVRGEQAAVGVEPAGKRLEAATCPVVELDDRLVVGHHLAPLQPPP